MRIHIVGAGVVGIATGRIFKRFGHHVEYSDIRPVEKDWSSGQFHIIGKGNIIPGADIHFICVPESAAPDAVRRIGDIEGAIVIRSSVLPGTTKVLSEELSRPLWHNPEFLREAVAESDFRYEPYAIIGRSQSPCEPYGLADAYAEMGKEVIRCTSTESEFLKLLLNSYLATQISFWNDIKPLCDLMGVNSHKVAQLVAMDPRVSKYGAYLHGAPYGGRCLPKDLEHLLELRERLVDAFGPRVRETKLLEAVRQVNIDMGGM